MYYSLCREYDTQCASGSAVEHHLAKVGVAGSIPVSRSEGGVRIALQGWFGSFLMLKEIKNDYDDRRLQCLRFFCAFTADLHHRNTADLHHRNTA